MSDIEYLIWAVGLYDRPEGNFYEVSEAIANAKAHSENTNEVWGVWRADQVDRQYLPTNKGLVVLAYDGVVLEPIHFSKTLFTQ